MRRTLAASVAALAMLGVAAPAQAANGLTLPKQTVSPGGLGKHYVVFKCMKCDADAKFRLRGVMRVKKKPVDVFGKQGKGVSGLDSDGFSTSAIKARLNKRGRALLKAKKLRPITITVRSGKRAATRKVRIRKGTPACTLMTPAEASVIAGEAMGPGLESKDQLPGQTCTFTTLSPSGIVPTNLVIGWSGGFQGSRPIRESYPFDEEPVPVAGVGDEAFYTESPFRTLIARKGDQTVTILFGSPAPNGNPALFAPAANVAFTRLKQLGG